MPDALAGVLDGALATHGLGWIVLAALLSGLVRGFAGFGTALVFLPVAAQVLDPFDAIVVLVIMDVAGPLPNIPRALRTADAGDLARLAGGTVLTLPLGLWLLGYVSPEAFRVGVSLLALAMLAALLTGFRYRGPLGPRLVLGTGALAGFLGGLTGIPGPPIILLYMASTKPVAVVRASNMAYLFLYDLLLIGVLAVTGILRIETLALGALLVLPNLLGNVAGAMLFRPGRERGYRGAAYAIIAASALSGLRP